MSPGTQDARIALISSLTGLCLCLFLALLTACNQPSAVAEERHQDAGTTIQASQSPAARTSTTQIRFEPSTEDFWRLPLPSDLRQQSDGSYDWERWPDTAENNWVSLWLDALERRKDAFGVNSAVHFPLTGSVALESLPKDAQASLEPNASVFLINVDPDSEFRGERLPIHVYFTQGARRYAPDYLLTAVPHYGFVRRPSSKYAVILTNKLTDEAGAPLTAPENFRAALLKAPGAERELSAHLAPLRETLLGLNVDLHQVVGATIFSTLDAGSSLRKLETWSEGLPLPALEPWQVHSETDETIAIQTRYSVPVIQSGMRPFTDPGEGLIKWEGDVPHVFGQQPFRFILTLPKNLQANTLPVVLYLHGSGGRAEQVLDRGPREQVQDAPAAPPGTGPARWLAEYGFASVGFDFPLHGERNDPPDETGLLLYNLLGNIDATIDNFTVAAAELTMLTRVLESLQIQTTDVSELEELFGKRTLRLDEKAFSAMGQSMGSTIGIPWASVDPRLDAAVWSGAGGILAEIALTATEPLPLKPVLSALMEIDSDELTPAHPLLHAFQSLWDLVDPVSYAPGVSREGWIDSAPKHQLMLAGFEDGYFSPTAQGALGIGLGAPLVGSAVEDHLVAWLELASKPSPSALVANINNRSTVGLVQHRAPNGLGHEILFNQAEVQAQVLCFLQGVDEHEAPRVVPDPAAAACP